MEEEGRAMEEQGSEDVGQGSAGDASAAGEAAAASAAVARTDVAPGWYPDPNSPGTDRYWNGTEWTDQTQAGSVSTTKKSAEERKAIMAQQIQMVIAQGGRIESQSEYQAVIVTGKPLNNTLHAILTFFTCLIWGIVWLILYLTGGEKRQIVAVDEYGNATVQQLGKR